MEFEYLVVDGSTCDRCGDSRASVRDAVADARVALASAAEIDLIERELPPSRLSESNRVLVDGRPAEDWLGGSSSLTDCPSCAELVGGSACCREIEVGGVRSEAFSRSVVFDAIMAAAGLARGGVRDAASHEDALPLVTLVTGAGCG